MNRLLAFYGDDFTGSSASAEVLAFAGIPTVMFLANPNPEQLARFADRQAIGIAGMARAKSPAWMDANLPAFFETLAGLGAPISHYKVCSTFDSSPEIGSIGRAIDIAAPILGGQWHPLLIAAPAIRRYQLFGNLFAAVDGTGYRLDRHPTMSRHPVTPMAEADVRLHLAKQTNRSIGLIDRLQLRDQPVLPRSEIVAIDILDEEDLAAAGRLIWEQRGERLFAIGSQGIEYALVAHWREIGLIDERSPVRRADPAPIAAVSGSCSPVTARQIERAEANGFALIELDVGAIADGWQDALDSAAASAIAAIRQGRNLLVYTARGPDDPAVAGMRAAVARSGMDAAEANAAIGAGLGSILAHIVANTDIRRLAIAGGDTSGAVMAELGILALEAEVELAPACALNRAHGEHPDIDGIEIALKGGQMGPPDFFNMIARGKPAPGEAT